MAFAHKLFTSLQNYSNPDTRIGELNRIWYDSINNVFRIQLDTTTAGGTVIGGAGGSYTLPVATALILGGVKIGSNITINAGVISVAAPFSGSYNDLTSKPTLFSGSYTDLTNKPTIPSAYSLLTATTSVLGGVKIDGTTITINGSGVITAVQAFSNQYVLYGTTTDGAETEILINGSTRIPVAVNTSVSYTVDVVARRTDVIGDVAAFQLRSVALNNANTVSDIGTVYEIVVARTDATMNVDAKVDNTYKSIGIWVTGVTGKIINWRAVVTTVEV
jgi:hypothetical protein